MNHDIILFDLILISAPIGFPFVLAILWILSHSSFLLDSFLNIIIIGRVCLLFSEA